MRNGIASGEAGRVETVLVEGAPRIRLVGECDVYTAPAVRAQLSAMLAEGQARIIFDLECATFLDSSILSIFLSAHRIVGSAGEVVLLCRPGFVRRLLALLEMDTLLKIQTPEEWRSAVAAVN